MPLKVRRRRDTGSLEIYGRVRPSGTKIGIAVRQRAGSDNEAVAREEAVAIEREILRQHHLGERPSVRSFAEALKSYLTFEQRTSRTLKACKRLVPFFGEMPLDRITQDTIIKARAALLRADTSNATFLRDVVVPLRAIMRHGQQRGWGPAPVFNVPRVKKVAPSFLTPAQAEALIACAAPHLQPLLRFLLCTGCRMGEALKLDWRSVDLAGARATLWEGETKGGERRVIALVPTAQEALSSLQHRTGPVFLTRERGHYRTSEAYGGQIKKGWATACRKAGIVGVTPHGTRHSWASWHYAVHRDLLRLKLDGGWASTLLVERYAHLMASGEEAAVLAFWGLPASTGAERGLGGLKVG
jgi:integrase